MAKHLGIVEAKAWEELQDLLLQWLDRHDVAGSIAGEYSLYYALDDEREKAMQALLVSVDVSARKVQ